MTTAKISTPKREDFVIIGLGENEKLFCVGRDIDRLNAHDKLIFEGYRFVGIKRTDNDETARKVRQYKEQGRELESLAVSVVLKDEYSGRSEQIVEGVEAYFVR